MPPIIIRVFVSSTWLDLQPERQAVETIVHRMRETKFVGMEYFGSRDETTQRASLDEVDRSQIYVGIFAERYGSGITEDEYRRARNLKLPCFIYFKHEDNIAAEWRDNDAAQIAKLAALKEELRRNHTTTEFNNTDDLAAKVVADLHRWLFNQYLQPQLERAAEGEMPSDQAQALLDAIKDTDALDAKLLSRVRQVIVSGNRNVAIGGDASHSIIVTGDGNVVNATAPVFKPLHQLPSPPRDFTGRADELGELLAALDRGAIISGLQGLGGVGKTALALKLADEVKDRYQDAQFYLDLRGVSDKPLTPAEAMAHVIRAYRPTDPLPESEAELSGQYRSVMHDQRALLLMDNARDDAQVRPLIPPATCLLLVTSRRHFTLPQMTARRLGVLSPEDAVELLHKVALRIHDWDGHDIEIADTCGRLPLALRAAGSSLEVTLDLRPADYVLQLRDERTRLETIGAEGVDYSVEACFNLSYERLMPETARVFRQLAVFAGSFDATAEETVCDDAGHKRLSELVRLSLVEYDDGERRYWLHDLVRLFTNSQMKEEKGDVARRRYAEYFFLILEKAQNLYLQGGEAFTRGMSIYDLEHANIGAGQAWAAAHTKCNERAAELCVGYSLVGWPLLELRLHPREQIRWLEISFAVARRFKWLKSEVAALGNIGIVHKNLGEIHKAIECFEQCLLIHRKLGDREGEGKDLGNLGIAYKELGEMRIAIEFHKQDLAIARELGDRRAEGQALSNLGIGYKNLGEISEAIECYQRRLGIAQELGDRRGEGNALGNLGIACFHLGEIHKAAKYHEQQLSIMREIGDRKGEGKALWGLGRAFHKVGDRARAIAHAEVALKIFEGIESPHGDEVRQQLAEWRGQL